MSQIKKKRANQDIGTVLMIGAVLVTGVIMIVLSAIYGSSFLAVVGVSMAFWSVLLLFFTPTKHTFLDLLKASASAGGSNIERSLTEFNSAEKGVYLPPQNIQNFESSLIFVPKTPRTALPASFEASDKLFTDKKSGLLLTPPGLALSLMFEHELGLSFRKINLAQMQIMITKLVHNLKFAEDAKFRIQDKTITLEVTGSIFNMLCQETQNSQPRTHAQVGCILASAFACAFAKASDKPITIQKDTLNADTKTLVAEYRMEEV
ncbi:MAG TPA: hypothetical protein VEF91_03245 [Verrucomicrobiae bacterium]|nr:hypothetical protein [Verrucomicrobiae bacterium]